MSDYKAILPHGITNFVEEPSFEGFPFVNWSTGGINTIAQSSVEKTRGVYSCLCTSQNSVAILIYTGMVLPAAGVYTISMKVFVPASWDSTEPLFIDALNFVGGSYVTIQDWDTTTFDEWITLEARLTVVGGDLTGDFRILYNAPLATAGRFIYVDEIQCELGTEITTYCDGDQDGCAWNGLEDFSTSIRSAASRAGGFIRDLQDDLNFDISAIRGAQVAPQRVNIDRFSILPGGSLNSIKINERPMTMTGVVRGFGTTSEEALKNMHARKQELVRAILPDSYPKDAEGYQPVRLRYTGAAVEKEIAAHYQSRLEGNLNSSEPCAWERLQIRWASPAPFWYAVGDSAQVLDSNDGAGALSAVARLKNTGQWNVLGPPGSGGVINSIVEDDTYVYYGGLFLNWDLDANSDNIVRWHKQNEAWSPLATGLNGAVLDMTVGPDGTLYVVGAFTDAGGDVNADYVAQWDGAAFTAIGIPLAGAAAITNVQAVEIDLLGNLWVGGDFTNFANIANGDYIAYWNGAAWIAPAVGADNIVYSLAIGTDNIVYASGDFANIGGIAAASIAQWDGTTWAVLGPGLNNQANGMIVSGDNVLYAVGAFTTAGGATANRVAFWNGTAWGTLGTGLDATALEIDIAPDGMIYVAGDFTEAGGITLADSVAKWNGSSWAHLDLDLPALPSVGGLLIGLADPVIASNYDVWIGFAGAAAATFSGLTTVSNSGTEIAFPKFIVERTGGTEAIIESLRNETTGKELLFDYALLDGERLTIDLTPTAKSFISSFFGSRPDAILPGSDVGEWSLIPGDNEITCFVNTDATVVAWLEWRDQYNGID